jgi:HSP20 family protein
MSNITIQKVAKTEDRSLSIFAETEELLRRIRERAFGLSRARGRRWASAMEDWLAAEREFCWPAAEFAERDKEFAVSVALPGFEPGNIVVTATPREMIVHAKVETRTEPRKDEQIVWSDFRSNDVYRRIELPGDIDVDKVSATLKNGLLEIVAAKLEKVDKPAKIVQVT